MTKELPDKIVIKGKGVIQPSGFFGRKGIHFKDIHIQGNYEIPDINIEIAKKALRLGYKIGDKVEYAVILKKKK